MKKKKKQNQPGGSLPGQINPPTLPASHGPFLGQVATLTNTAAGRDCNSQQH